MSNRRLIPFIYSAEIAYLVELGGGYARFYYEDVLIDSIDTPYTEQEIFELHFQQIADVMRIAHRRHAPKQLIRSTPITFQLSNIDIRTGPFLLRNDLALADGEVPATISCNVTTIGAFGNLTASQDVFRDGHQGALFELTFPRSDKILTHSGTGTSETIAGKGTMSLITRGTWTGEVVFQKNIGGIGWEDFRTYRSNNDRNASLSWVEEEDNVVYRIVSSGSGMSGFRTELTVGDPLVSGIVQIIDVIDPRSAACRVVSQLQSTDPTRRWAEGAWSDYRGWPGSITFFEERCCYAGGV